MLSSLLRSCALLRGARVRHKCITLRRQLTAYVDTSAVCARRAPTESGRASSPQAPACGVGECACSRARLLPHGRPPSARALSTRADASSLDVCVSLGADSVAAASPPELPALSGATADAPSAEEAALPAVDWNLSGGEATSAAGRVITAQANYMRVLVRWTDLTQAQRDGRRLQLQAARQAAADAGAARDVATLTAELEYEGPLEILCVVRALLKKMQHRVLVGDWVALSSVEWTARRAMVTAPLPRSGPPLVDPPVANVQQLVLCFALADPPVEAVQLTRFLVSAEATGLPFVLVFNKADLGTLQRRQDVAEHMRLWGYAGAAAPRFVSVATGEGTADLAALLSGIVTAIAGPSGVGKSSLINMLRCVEGASNTDADVIGAGGGNKSRVGASGGGASDWEDGAVAAADEDAEVVADADAGVRAGPAWEVQTVKAISGRSRRGRHTTRHVSLLRLPGGGLLADTPGFGLPSLDHVTTRELPYCFPEVRAALASGAACSFANCTHRDEPGCVARGEPTWERYPLYRELYEELLARETAAARSAGKREPGVRTKASRGSGTQPRVEVKLAPQKHRRVNRTNANALLAGELGRLQQEEEAIAEDAAKDATAAEDQAAEDAPRAASGEAQQA